MVLARFDPADPELTAGCLVSQSDPGSAFGMRAAEHPPVLPAWPNG